MNNILSNTDAVFTETSDKNNPQTMRARLIRLLLALLLLSGVWLLHSLEPGEIPLPECEFKSITGLPCPTCGITRSMQAAANLEIKESFIQHPFGLLLISVISVLFFFLLTEAITGKRLRLIPVKVNIKMIFIGLISVWWIYWLIRISYVLVESL